MTNTEIVQEITNAFCENKTDQQMLAKYFAPHFEHTINGVTSHLNGYSEHLANYARHYKRFQIPKWDELFAVDDKVVVSYTLEGERITGGEDKIAVMAIWRLADGKVVALREVDAKL